MVISNVDDEERLKETVGCGMVLLERPYHKTKIKRFENEDEEERK